MSDNMAVVGAKDVVKQESWADLAGSGMSTPDGFVPGGVAGFIVEEFTVLCHECGIDHPDVHEHSDDTHFREYSYGYIGCDEESDYPGTTCNNCNGILDTTILLYKNGPGAELYVKATNEIDTEDVKNQAYEMGLWQFKSSDPVDPEDEMAFDLAPFQGSAEYANSILPKLRELSGYEDGGMGTYTEDAEVYASDHDAICMASEVFNEDVMDAWQEGAYDGLAHDPRDN